MSVTLDELNEKVIQIASKLEGLIAVLSALQPGLQPTGSATQGGHPTDPPPVTIPPHVPQRPPVHDFSRLRFDLLRREEGGGSMGNEAAEIRRQRLKREAKAAAERAQQDVSNQFSYAKQQLGDVMFLQIAGSVGATVDSAGTVQFTVAQADEMKIRFYLFLQEAANNMRPERPQREPADFLDTVDRGVKEWERRMNEYQTL